MSQILDPLPQGQKDCILCSYVNSTSQIQVARITNIPNWYFERVVFPGQRLVFEALPSAMLEIHSGMMASAIVSDTILCDRLAVEEKTQQSKPAETPKRSYNRSVVHQSPKTVESKPSKIANRETPATV